MVDDETRPDGEVATRGSEGSEGSEGFLAEPMHVRADARVIQPVGPGQNPSDPSDPSATPRQGCLPAQPDPNEHLRPTPLRVSPGTTRIDFERMHWPEGASFRSNPKSYLDVAVPVGHRYQVAPGGLPEFPEPASWILGPAVVRISGTDLLYVDALPSMRLPR